MARLADSPCHAHPLFHRVNAYGSSKMQLWLVCKGRSLPVSGVFHYSMSLCPIGVQPAGCCTEQGQGQGQEHRRGQGRQKGKSKGKGMGKGRSTDKGKGMGRGKSKGRDRNKSRGRIKGRGKGQGARHKQGRMQPARQGIRLQTLTRFLKPSIRMSSAVKIRLAALRTSHALPPMATTATCRPVTPRMIDELYQAQQSIVEPLPSLVCHTIADWSNSIVQWQCPSPD